MEDFKVILEAMIDNSSLDNVQKQVAKERLKINADISVSDFAKSKQDIEKQITELSKKIQTILGDSVTNKQSTKWAKEYYDQMIIGAKNAAKEQEKVNREQEKFEKIKKEAKNNAIIQAEQQQLLKQKSIYNDIIKTQKQIYSLKNKLISSDILETQELNRQISVLEKQNKYNDYKLSKNGLSSTSYDKEVALSKKILEDQLSLNQAKQIDKSLSIEITNAEKEREKALSFTKDASKKLSSAISKYSYGDSSDARALMQKMNRGVSNFGDLSNVKGNIESLSSDIDSIILKLQTSHKKNLDSINEQIRLEKKLQSEKDIANKKSIEAIEKEQQSVLNKANTVKSSVDNLQSIAQYKSLIEKTEQWTDANGKALISTNNLKSAMTNLAVANERYSENKSVENAKKLTTVYDEFNKEIKTVTSNISLMNTRLAKDSDISSFTQRIQEFKDKNPKAMKTFGNSIDGVLNKLKSGASITNKELQDMKQQFVDIKNEARQAGKLGNTFFGSIKEGIKSFTAWTSGTALIMKGISTVKDMGKSVYDIDTAMTSLYKVTDETDKKYNQFLDSACNKSKELGRSVSGLVEQTAEWAKLGYSIDDAAKLSEISSIYSNVGEVDNDTAVSDIVTAMKSFDIQAQDSMKIIDMYNKLGNEFAVSANDIGLGVKNSASALALQGNSIEQVVAMLTGAGEITQDVGELGNMLKVASMRLASMKGKLEEIGEEYEDIQSVSKNQTQIYNMTNGQVNILDEQNGKLKDTYTILKDVSNAWEEVNSLDKNTLLELMFGKQRANQGAAILTAFQSGQIQKAYDAALHSNGSAIKEQERWLQSLEAKTQKFNSAFQSLSNTVINSDLLKWFVDFGTGTVESIDSIISKVGLLTTVFTGLGGILGSKNLLSVKNIDGELKFFNKTILSTKDNLNNLENAKQIFVHNENGVFDLDNMSFVNKSVSEFTKINNAFNSYNSNLSKSTQLQNAYIKAVGNQSASLGNYLAGLNGANASMGGYVKSLVGAKAATIGLQVASVALNMAISMGLSLAISAIVSGITKWVNKAKEARENAIATAQSAKQESESLYDLLSKYNQLSEEVKTNTSVKDSLISTQNELLKSLGIEQSELDELIKKYGSLNDAINQVTLDSLKDAHGELLTGYNVYKKDLLKAGSDGFWGGNNIIDASGNGAAKAFKTLESKGVIDGGSYGSSGGALVLLGDDSTVDGILKNYEKLKEAQNALNEAISEGEFTEEEMSSNPLYNAIQNKINDLKGAVDGYTSAISDVNKNSASQQIISSLLGEELPKTTKEFEVFKNSVIDAAQASNNFIGSQQDIEDSIINTLSNMSEFSQYFSELENVETSFTNSIGHITSSLSDESSKSIDNFQSKIESLASTISYINDGSLSANDRIELFQQFPELIDESDNLETAIKTLINSALNDLLDTLGESIPSNLKKELIDIANEATGSKDRILSFSEAMSTLGSNTNDIQSIKEEFDNFKQLSEKSLNSIISMYPELENSVIRYQQGIIDTAELFSLLDDAYKTDVDNYKRAMVNKMSEDDSFWAKLCNDNASAINEFNKNYGIDLGNYKTLAESKLKIEQELITNLSKIWSKYYSIVYDENGMANVKGGNFTENLSPEEIKEFERSVEGKAYRAARMQADKHNAAIQELNNLANNSTLFSSASFTSGNFKSTSEKDKKGERDQKDQKDQKETIDFIERKTNKLNDTLEKQKALTTDTTLSYKRRKEEIKNTITLIDNQLPKYEKAASNYLTKAESVGLSESLKKKVDNGSYNIKDYSSKTAQKIKEYEEWMNKYKEIFGTIEDLKSEKHDFQLQLDTNDIGDTVDWVETKIENLNKSLEKQKKIADDTTLSYKNQKEAIKGVIASIDKSIPKYQKSADEYLDRANSVNISDSLKNKIQNGSYNIKDYSPDTVEKINAYKEWYEKYLGIMDTIESLEVTNSYK